MGLLPFAERPALAQPGAAAPAIQGVGAFGMHQVHLPQFPLHFLGRKREEPVALFGRKPRLEVLRQLGVVEHGPWRLRARAGHLLMERVPQRIAHNLQLFGGRLAFQALARFGREEGAQLGQVLILDEPGPAVENHHRDHAPPIGRRRLCEEPPRLVGQVLQHGPFVESRGNMFQPAAQPGEVLGREFLPLLFEEGLHLDDPLVVGQTREFRAAERRQRGEPLVIALQDAAEHGRLRIAVQVALQLLQPHLLGGVERIVELPTPAEVLFVGRRHAFDPGKTLGWRFNDGRRRLASRRSLFLE